MNFSPGHAAVTVAVLGLALVCIAASSAAAPAQAGPSPNAASNSEPFPCQENWSCSGWGNCTSGVASRICEDANDCGTEINKPLENQSCLSLTGIVKLTILPSPEVCGDLKCSKNETCRTCPGDCGRCYPAFAMAGLVTGAGDPGLPGLIVAVSTVVILFATVYSSRKKGNR